MENEVIQDVLGKIDRHEITRLVMQLIDIPSSPGQEKDVAEFILTWLKENELESISQEVEPGRLNAVGILRGSARGLSLMFNGHLDTNHPGTLEDLEAIGAGIASPFRPKAILEDDIVYGLGSYNCKGGVAAALIALKALKEGGVNLSGDMALITDYAGKFNQVFSSRTNAEHAHLTFRLSQFLFNNIFSFPGVFPG